MRARDNRRQRLYNAERAVTLPESAAAKRLLHGGKRVESTGNISIEACQAYVDHVTRSAWFQRRWGRQSLTVTHKVYGAATGGGGEVTLPPWARTEWVILHEIAHNLTPRQHAAHGPEFAAVFLTLVRQQMGKVAYDLLRGALRDQRFGKVAPLVRPNPAFADLVVARAELEAKAARQARSRSRIEREREQRQREATQRRLLGYTARAEAQASIRALIKAGHFGAPGSADRKAALRVARRLGEPLAG